MGIDEPSTTIEVAATDSPTAKPTTYQATSVTKLRTTEVGKSSAKSTDVRIEEAAYRRRQAFEATHYEQTWLEAGEREAALQFVRSRLRRAREKVLIADPYLGFRQIKQFMFAIPTAGVTVTLLTSRLAFESRHAEDAELIADSASQEAGKPTSRLEELARLDAFRKEVAELRAHTSGDIRVFVLPGTSPALHDRFLSVDDALWFFGGSFNGLGERASLAIRLPQVDGILSKLQTMIGDSRTLDDHIELRAVTPVQASPAGSDSTLWSVAIDRLCGVMEKATAACRKWQAK